MTSPEQRFTDEDLQRLKERIQFVGMPESEEIPRLLARLEAAEKVCEALRRYLVNQDHDDFDLALIAWRQVSGK